MQFIRIKDIGSKLPPDQAIKALAMSLEELALVKALEIIHGSRAVERYINMGGHVRFDEDGEPGLVWEDMEK